MLEKQIRKQVRLKTYDYSSNGYYFITICSKDRQNIFCRISQNIDNPVVTGLAPVKNENINIKLSKLGKIIKEQWQQIPDQFGNVSIDEFVIMPNHTHGIIILNKKDVTSPVRTISGIVGSFKSKSSIKYLKYIKPLLSG